MSFKFVVLCFVLLKNGALDERLSFLDFWIFGFLDSWILGFLDFWIFGFLDSWILGFLDSWILGFLDSWKKKWRPLSSRNRILIQRYESGTFLRG